MFPGKRTDSSCSQLCHNGVCDSSTHRDDFLRRKSSGAFIFLQNAFLVLEISLSIEITREFLADKFMPSYSSVFGRGTDEQHTLQVAHSQAPEAGEAVEQT